MRDIIKWNADPGGMTATEAQLLYGELSRPKIGEYLNNPGGFWIYRLFGRTSGGYWLAKRAIWRSIWSWIRRRG